ncbi:MAG: hypothetical protein AAFR56_06405, partial [Chloroflexota bacterium]
TILPVVNTKKVIILTYLSVVWGVLRRVGIGMRWLLLLVMMLMLLRNSTLKQTPYFSVAVMVKDAHFDYIGWEIEAIRTKVGQALSGGHAYITEDERVQFVYAYFTDLTLVRHYETQIETIYSSPAVTDPDSFSAELRSQRDALRGSLQERQTAVEAIIQEQVATVLREEGFDVGGQLMPPMNMRFVGQTLLLVTSPRNAIDMEHTLTLTPITVDEREAIEQRILDEQDLSAVIVPIGGMALYPAMIVESASLSYTLETFAHEWLHHYLMFHPLGIEAELGNNGETRIINETTASIFGREMGRVVLERYYPEPVPMPVMEPLQLPQPDDPEPRPETRPIFDYGNAMHETRVTVDDLLAEGKIEEAEAYMEERRRLFFENGIRIRKLNQAWFSFYGGYQVAGIDAGGEDPIGPAVQRLRDDAPTIREWVRTMQSITTRTRLLEVATLAQ